jgi:hypothetical protein
MADQGYARWQMCIRIACVALAVLTVSGACAGEERPEVERVAIAGVSGVPSVRVPPPVTIDSGERFERVVALLPSPLPAPVPVVLPEMTEATSTRTCFPVRLEIELSGGRRARYDECDFPRAVLPACASASIVLPTEYRCPSEHPASAFSVDPAVDPRTGAREVTRIVKRELGEGSRIEEAVAVPTDVTACGFVGVCPPEPSSGAPRPVWFVTAYDDEGVIAPPVYLLIEDATGKVIAERTRD